MGGDHRPPAPQGGGTSGSHYPLHKQTFFKKSTEKKTCFEAQMHPLSPDPQLLLFSQLDIINWYHTTFSKFQIHLIVIQRKHLKIFVYCLNQTLHSYQNSTSHILISRQFLFNMIEMDTVKRLLKKIKTFLQLFKATN